MATLAGTSQFFYDDVGRLFRFRDSIGTETVDDYVPTGLLKSVTYPNGVIPSFTTNDRNRLKGGFGV